MSWALYILTQKETGRVQVVVEGKTGLGTLSLL
jgi:hypothetical protein